MSAESLSVSRRRSRPLVTLALLAFVVAQLAAQLHVLGHSRANTDPSGLPDRHTRLCAECASFVPLLAMMSAVPLPPATVPHTREAVIRFIATTPAELRPAFAFRSRAPPA